MPWREDATIRPLVQRTKRSGSALEPQENALRSSSWRYWLANLTYQLSFWSFKEILVNVIASPSSLTGSIELQLPDQPDASNLSASAGAVGSPAALETPKPAYPPVAEIPTQEGPEGLRFDFNDGARVLCPDGRGPWQVRIWDVDTGNVLFETEFAAGRVTVPNVTSCVSGLRFCEGPKRYSHTNGVRRIATY